MASQRTGLDAKGFFASLFDLSFSSFITLKFIRVIYAVLLLLIGLLAVGLLLAALASGEAGIVVLAIVGVPVAALVYLVLARIYLEVIAVLFRIGENTTRLVQAASLPGAASPPPPGAGGPAAPGPGWAGPEPGSG